MKTVFDPISLGVLRLPSRFIRSATAERIAMEQEADSERLGALYANLIRGGVGLVITGHVAVHPSGRLQPLMAALYAENHFAAWRRAVAIAHQAGGLLVAQLNHGGGRCKPEFAGAPVCVSRLPDWPKDPLDGTELTGPQIEDLIAAFAWAVQRAQEFGFDGVQIHAAHGYLGSQFLSPATNRRTDDWGGALENRARFLRRVLQAVRRAVGPDYPIGMKLGACDDDPAGLSIQDTLQAAEWFVANGLNFIEISGAFRSDLVMRKVKPGSGEGYYLPFARQFKQRLSIPVIAVGGFRSLEVINGAIGRGDCDAVAMARPLIRQPDLPNILRQGGRSECVGCDLCLLHNDGPTRCWAREKAC